MDKYIEHKATCRDCIHYPVCKDTVADENWDEDAPKEVKEMYSPKSCENFKPAVDVVEVQHGKWIKHQGAFNRFECSACGDYEFYHYPYCHYCGAKMDGKGEE